MQIDKEKTLILLEEANERIMPYCMTVLPGPCQDICPRYNLCQFLLDLQEYVSEEC